MSGGRQKKTIEFTPPDVAAIAYELRALRSAGGGWVNLLPGIDEDASDVHPRAGLFAFFGNNAAPVTMTTVMPPKQDRSDTEGLAVGIMHPTGSHAVERLAEDFPGDPATGLLDTSEEAEARFEDFANDEPCAALDPATVSDTLGVLLKYQDDIAKLEGSKVKELLDEVKSEMRAAE